MRRAVSQLVLLGLVLSGAAWGKSKGDALKGRFGSDGAAEETFWQLVDRTVDLDASFGYWQANLSGGLSALTAKLDDSSVNEAIDSISTGSGLVREVKFSVRVGENRAFFSYLSDRLFEATEKEIEDQVDHPIAREALLQLVGELRPDMDLGDMFPDDARAYLRFEYGRITGDIENPERFAVRNGEPWFGGTDAEWSTEYFNIETGYLAGSDYGMSQFEDMRGGWEDSAAGLFARYTQFTKPLVLGFGEEAGIADAGFTLHDAELTVYSLGMRFEVLSCETVCWNASGTFIPFTGIAQLDLGRWGDTAGVVFGGGFDVGASLPWNIFGSTWLSPYASFRADFLFPIFLGSAWDVDIDRITLWLPDYLIWGPSAGISGRF